MKSKEQVLALVSEMIKEAELVFSASGSKKDSMQRFQERYEKRKQRLLKRWDKLVQEKQ